MRLNVVRFQVFLLLTLLMAVPVQAQFPFSKKKAPAANENPALSERAGPWLIMCSSFVGEDGMQQARRLTQELRQQHGLKAYIYSHKFDFSKSVAGMGRGWEVVQTPGNGKKLRPIQMETQSKSKFEEIAVLVGDFDSIDDPKAQRTLEKIKSLQPASLNGVETSTDEAGPAGDRLLALRMSANANGQQSGPFRYSFLMPNPMIPEEHFAARKVDDYTVKFNKRFEFSLLKNPSVYTVKVATFTGASTMKPNEMEKRKEEDNWLKRKRKGKSTSRLMEGAKKATLLTRDLRNKGFEAYEFHDRYESVVCIGGFDWAVQRDSSGVEHKNPEMVALMRKFQGTQVPGQSMTVKPAFRPSTALAKAGISCDAWPVEYLIPKAPVQSTATRFLSGFGKK